VQDRISIALKWTADDGSSPLNILLSKYCPEIAAKNANTTTAVDCGRPDVLKRWNDAVHSPTEAQKCKQVGDNKIGLSPTAASKPCSSSTAASKPGSSSNFPVLGLGGSDYDGSTPPETTHQVLSERREMEWTEERPDGTVVTNVHRQTTSVDDQGRTAVVNEVNISVVERLAKVVAEMAEFNMREFKNVDGNLVQVFKTIGKHGREIEAFRKENESTAVAIRTQAGIINGVKSNIREIETLRNYDKAETEKKLAVSLKMNEDLKAEVKNLRGSVAANVLAQKTKDDMFDVAYAKNHDFFQNTLNAQGGELDSMWKEIQTLKAATTSSLPSGDGAPSSSSQSLGESSMPSSSKGKEVANGGEIFNGDASVGDVVDGLMQLHGGDIQRAHSEVNANPMRRSKMMATLKQIPAVREPVTSSQVSAQPGVSFPFSEIHDPLTRKTYEMGIKKRAVYEWYGYKPETYFTSGEFAKDEFAGRLFCHPLECIGFTSIFPMFKVRFQGKDFTEKAICIKSVMELRRKFCIDHPTSSLAMKSHQNFIRNEKAKKASRSVASNRRSSMRQDRDVAAVAYNCNGDTDSDSIVSVDDTMKDADYNP
jgi:hypothetical protein